MNRFTSLCIITFASIVLFAPTARATDSKPTNIVIIFMDDMGYGDIGPFGSKIPTPNLDRMAREGRRFTDFVVASAVCSASRAALMTGCIHERVSIIGALGPNANHGLAESEMTIAEVCKQRNYSTACFGKWHLGHQPKFLPTNQGFDHYLGLPYSNDMWPQHPEYARLPKDADARKRGYPNLPMLQNDQVIDPEVTAEVQTQLTTKYTDAAVQFIRDHRDKPFFLYMPHSMVHVPLFVSDKFAGKHQADLFAEVVMEVDWSVGQVLQTLAEVGVDENTLVVFTSDNGPWLSYGNHAGSAGPLREGKGTSWEGGVRVPTLMRWPQRIPAGTECSQLASTIDLLPTIAGIIDAKLPSNKIDGKNILALMTEQDAPSPHESLPYYYANHELQAIRDARWKLVFPHTYRTLADGPGGKEGTPSNYQTRQTGLELYDLKNDLGESKNVASEHPDIVQRLQKAADAWRDDLGDSLTKRAGQGIRAHGTLLTDDRKLTW